MNIKVIKAIFHSLIFLTATVLIVAAVMDKENFSGWAGDAFEYTMMLESLYNHQSPELRSEDIVSFKSNYPGVYEWCIEYYTVEINKSKNFFDDMCGYFVSLDGNYFSYHFWLYSLLNLPSKLFVHLTGIKKSLAFGITHAIFTCLFLWYLARNKNFSSEKKIYLVSGFLFSPALFYFKWVHTEYLSCLFIYWAFLFLYEKRYYPAIFLSALAAVHAPPVAFFTLLLVFYAVYKIGFSFRNLFICGISSVWVIVPSIFYCLKFGTPNLIIHSGYDNNIAVAASKFFSFFFDLNQGMIIAIAPFMAAFIALYLKNIIQSPVKWNFDMIVLPIVCIIVYASLGMTNWNHGQAVFIRYGSWVSIFIIAYTVYNLDIQKLSSKIFLWVVIILQAAITISHGGFYPNNNGYLKHGKVAKFVMDNCPGCYNPEPEIFIERSLGHEGFGPDMKPETYYDKKGKRKKAIISKLSLENNDTTGLHISSGKLVKKHNWYYINY